MKIKELQVTKSPIEVANNKTFQRSDGNFNCSSNKLKSLDGCPNEIKGSFDSSDNRLVNLIGGPSIVSKYYYCNYNQLTSLEGAPKKIQYDFFCNNNQLTSLDGIPEYVKHSIDLSYNKLTSLEGIHKQIKSVNYIDAADNPIKSHVLGLLLIDNLTRVVLDNKKLQNIINKYLKEGKDVFECQNELMEAGLDDFAQL